MPASLYARIARLTYGQARAVLLLLALAVPDDVEIALGRAENVDV